MARSTWKKLRAGTRVLRPSRGTGTVKGHGLRCGFPVLVVLWDGGRSELVRQSLLQVVALP